MESHSRRRFKLALAHQQPDRAPLDIGATTLTGLKPQLQEALLKHLGIPGPRIPGHANVDERILEWAGTDFRGVGGLARLPSPHCRRLTTNTYVDAWGITWEETGDDIQTVNSPLKGASLDDLKNFRWPEARVDEQKLREWEERAKSLKAAGQYVIVGEHPVYGVMELGCWMCGYDDFMLKMALEPDFITCFAEKYFSIQLEVIRQYYSVLGPYIDLTMSADDFGTQKALFMSPVMYNELVFPWLTERIRQTKAIAKCLYFHHTCGAIVPIIDDLIRCGVDILNPIQTSAVGMEPADLKARFGDRLVFWGAVDVQQFLPSATPEEIRAGVRHLRDTLGKNGGYVMAPAHEMQEDIPVENVAAWVETVLI